MMNAFSGDMLGVVWVLHGLFCLGFFIGLVLFVVWLTRFLLKKKQLLLWAIVLLVVGVLGMVLTFQGHTFGKAGMYQYMLDEEHEEFNSPEEFREHMLEEMEERMGL